MCECGRDKDPQPTQAEPQCQPMAMRERTFREDLEHLIERKSAELSGLRHLAECLPVTMHWNAEAAMKRLLHNLLVQP